MRSSSAKELACVVGCATILICAWGWGRLDRSDTFVVLADAWLHGRYDIDYFSGVSVSAAIDAVLWNGRRIICEGPFPAVVLLPFVKAFGARPEVQACASRAVGIVCVALLWRLFYQIGLRRRWRIAMCAFALISTDLWWCSAEGSVFFFSPVVAFALTIAAISEGLGRARGWLIGILAVAAAFTRFPLLPAVLILYPYLILRTTGWRANLRQYAIVCAIGVMGWVAYNELRWQTWNDIGYEVFCAQDPGCAAGLAGPQYLAYEIYSFFLRGPLLVEGAYHLARFPYLDISPEGMALTFSSPALIIAFYVRRSPQVAVLWLTTVLVAVPSLLYYLSGWVQVGNRHALDFEPFLIVLMACALRDTRARWWFAPIIALSVAVGFWQAWYAHAFRCC